MRSSSVSTARMVIAMLSPVSPSATGNTFRSFTSWRRRSISSSAVATTLRNRTRLSSGTSGFLHLSGKRTADGRPGLGRLEDLAGLEAAGADVLAARRAADVDAHLLEVRVEASLGRDHRVAAAMAERRTLSTHVTDLWHGGEG